MAKWWLLNVQFPERSDIDIFQIYADTPEMAISGARAWLKAADASVYIRDSSDQPFSNQMITSTGLKDPPGGDVYEEPPPTGGGTPPPDGGGGTPPGGDGFIGPPQELPEDEIRARFLQGLQQRGVNLGSISGRAMAKQEDEYRPAFQFRQGLQGFSPNPTKAG